MLNGLVYSALLEVFMYSYILAIFGSQAVYVPIILAIYTIFRPSSITTIIDINRAS